MALKGRIVNLARSTWRQWRSKKLLGLQLPLPIVPELPISADKALDSLTRAEALFLGYSVDCRVAPSEDTRHAGRSFLIVVSFAELAKGKSKVDYQAMIDSHPMVDGIPIKYEVDV